MKKPFKPMGGCNIDLDKLKYPVYVSIKVDGIRTNIYEGLCRTKSLKPLANVYTRNLLESLPVMANLEAELTTTTDLTDSECFNKATSAFMTHKGVPAMFIWIFDAILEGVPFEKRYEYLLSIRDKLPANARVMHQEKCDTRGQLEVLIALSVANNYEGLMVRHHDSLYKFGKATVTKGELLKVKPMEDAEAIIEGFEEGTNNLNPKVTNELGRSKRSSSKSGKVPSGMVGTVLGRHPEWGIVRISGMKDDVALDMMKLPEKYLGKIVTFKYQAHGTLEAPRLAKYKGIRSPDDLSLPEEE